MKIILVFGILFHSTLGLAQSAKAPDKINAELDSASDTVGIAICRKGSLEAGYVGSQSQDNCSDVRTRGEGHCRGGSLKAGYVGNQSRDNCNDVKSEGEGICRSGSLIAGYNAKQSIENCKDL